MITSISRRTLLVSAGALAIVPLADGVAGASPSEGLLRYVSFVVRADGMSHAEFTEAFLAQGRNAAGLVGVVGLVVSEITSNLPPFALSGLDIDGMMEIWVRREADFEAMMSSPAGKEWWAATDGLSSRDTTFVCRDHVFIPPAERSGKSTLTLIVRKDGWSHEAFLDHWLGIHGPLATKVEGLLGFVLGEVLRVERTKGGQLMPEVDGIAEGWGTPTATPYLQSWYDDGAIFIDRDKTRNVRATGQVIVPVT